VCNLYPSCSSYTKEKIEKFWFFKWVFLWYKRLKLCKKVWEKK
jgi:putative component of membrane protein insertase Oxa1/YidC/SpoIIIJ protein YidD